MGFFNKMLNIKLIALGTKHFNPCVGFLFIYSFIMNEMKGGREKRGTIWIIFFVYVSQVSGSP